MSQSVVIHDEFDAASYRETLKLSTRLSGTLKAMKERLPLATELVESLYYSFYRPSPSLVEESALSLSGRIIRQMVGEIMSTTEWESVRQAGSVGDQLYSGIATASVAKSVLDALDQRLLKLLQELREAEAEAARLFANAEALDELAGQAQGDRAQGLYQQAREARTQAQKYEEDVEGMARELSQAEEEIEDGARQAGRFGLEAAEEDITQTEAAIKMLTGGYGGGGNAGKAALSLKDRLSLAGEVSKSTRLKEIAELCGRLHRIALACQKSKIKHPPDEIVGVRIGDDLFKTLPAELAQLSDPALAPWFYKKFAEGQLLQLDMIGSEKQGRGPVIVALDSSGSMGQPLGQHAKEPWSKAVMLALLAIARLQKRDFAVIHFSNPEIEVYEYPKGEADPDALMKCTDMFIGGGTNYEPWMHTALNMVEKSRWDKADVICISDGDVKITAQLQAEWNRRRAAKGMRCYSVLLGDESGAAQLGRVSDALCKVGDLAADNDALQMMFSI
jgi:uncharacterized protein with von Willebrand factor type A (vWA) domain